MLFFWGWRCPFLRLVWWVDEEWWCCDGFLEELVTVVWIEGRHGGICRLFISSSFPHKFHTFHTAQSRVVRIQPR